MARSTPARGAGRTPKTGSKGTPKRGGHEGWMDDEIDTHHRHGRDKISLHGDDDDDDEDEDDDDLAGVMDIDADDSDEDDSEEEDDDEDEDEDEDEGVAKKKGGGGVDDDDDFDDDDGSDDDEEDAALIRAMKAQQKRLNSKGATRMKHADDSDESDDDEDEDNVDAPAIRGKRKSDFYGGDEDIDHEGMSDEEERKDEEREARRLQKTQAEGMSAADYGLSDDEDDSSSDEDEGEATLGAKAKNLTAKGKAAAAAAAAKASAKKGAKKKAGGGLFGEEGTAVIESVAGDASDGAAAGNVVASDAPELIALTKELTKNLDEVRTSVEPVIAAVRAGDYATAEGISYLDAKHLLMLSYCINIVFYLLLKSEGKPVRDHPVVLRLVEIRTYLEKLRPIDRKLQYQIEKLLKMANEGAKAGDDVGEDPLNFRPNPEALVSKVEEDAEEHGGGDGGAGVYRPPKMLPTAMEDFEEGGKSAKEKRKEKEARRRANRSALIKELAQELGEAPEELGGDEGDMSSAFAKREFARMEARAKIEEDLFTRVPLSKVERRRQKATTRSMNSLAEVGDFGDDVADLVDVVEELEGQRGKRQRLVDVVSQGANPKQKNKPVSGEQDVPLRDTLGDRRNKYEKGVNRKIAEQQARENGMYGDDEPGPGASAYVSDDDEYTAAAATRDAKRAAKEEKYRRQAGIIAAPEEEMDDDEKREIGNKIMANRGLTPHRNKDHKNPRKRLRGKFEKAVVRRKGQVRAMREDGGGYGGEASGIKTTVTKSRRFGA